MRGKKTSPEDIYRVMTSYAITNNFNETARDLGMAASSVKDIVDKNKDKDEFVRLRIQKENEFADKASSIIDDGLYLLKRRMSRAINQEDNLDMLIDEIYSTDKEELTQDEKNKLVTKIRALQLQDVKALTTAIGTLYDKRALSRGESTENTKITFDLPPEVNKYAE